LLDYATAPDGDKLNNLGHKGTKPKVLFDWKIFRRLSPQVHLVDLLLWIIKEIMGSATINPGYRA